MLARFFSGTNWLLILSLVLGSAGLAVLGDIVGTKYGKKRMSIFRLRPKHTSRLITAFTGALIAIGILAVTSVLSQDVRTALFGMKILQQQLYDLQFQLTQSEANAQQARIRLAEAAASLDLTSFELDSMKNDQLLLELQRDELQTSLALMREESQQLKDEIKSLRSEAIAVNANVLLGQAAFEPGMTRTEIISAMNALKQQVRLNVLAQVSDQSFTRMRDIPVEFDAGEEAAVIDELVSSDMRHYVRALSVENYVFDENLRITARLETGTSIIIYPDGEPVYRKFFMNDTQAKSAETLHVFLRELRNKAINDGILPEPSTNNVGTLDGAAFFNAVEELGGIDSPVIISAVASGDIYTEGPVVIDIVFEE